MPIVNRMRGGQMLFTQPQQIQEIPYSQSTYMELLYNRRRPSATQYKDVKADKLKALPGYVKAYNQDMIEIEKQSTDLDAKMGSLMANAGAYDNMTDEEKAQFSSTSNELNKVAFRKAALESNVKYMEENTEQWAEVVKDAKEVGEDPAMYQVDGRGLFLQKTKQVKAQDGKVYSFELNNLQDIDNKAQSAEIVYNPKYNDYDIESFNPSGDYKYTGTFLKHQFDLYGKADNQYVENAGTTKITNYGKDEQGNISFNKNATAVEALGAVITDSQVKSDAKALAQVKNIIWSDLQKDSSAMKDLGQLFAKQYNTKIDNVLTQFTNITKEEATEFAKKGFRTFETTGADKKTIYQVAGIKNNKGEIEDKEVQSINKVKNGQELTEMDYTNLERMQKNFAFKSTKEMSSIFASNDLEISRREISFPKNGDGSGTGSEYQNTAQTLADWKVAQTLSDGQGNTEQFNAVKYKDGKYTPDVSKMWSVNLTGQLAQNIDQMNSKMPMASYTTVSQAAGGDLSHQEYLSWGGTQPDFQKQTGERSFVTKQGFVVNTGNAGMKPILLDFNKEDVWLPGFIKENGTLKHNGNTSDEAMSRFNSGNVIMTRGEMKDIVLNVIEEEIEVENNDWIIESQNGTKIANSIAEYEGLSLEEQASRSGRAAVVFKNTVTGEILDSRDKVPALKKVKQDKKITIEDIADNDEELAKYGMEKVYDSGIIGRNVHDRYIITAYIPANIEGTMDPSESETKAGKGRYNSIINGDEAWQKQIAETEKKRQQLVTVKK